MVFLRLHLDDNTAEGGVLRIARGSHRLGLVPAVAARAQAETFPPEDCAARRGDVLALKMLVLHASSASASPRPRRVFRIDLAPAGLLPPPLAWI